jgi:predicted transcriptional regulator
MSAPSPILPAITALLGPREADIMRLLWMHGSATVRELHTWLVTDPPLACTTVMTTCVRLTEKGLLERRHVTPSDERSRQRKAYVYTPRLSEQEFARSAVGQRIGQLLTHYPAFVEAHVIGFTITRRLTSGTDRAHVERLLAYLGTLRDSSGQRTEAIALDTIAALLERAEAAERVAATSIAEAQRASSAPRPPGGVRALPSSARPCCKETPTTRRRRSASSSPHQPTSTVAPSAACAPGRPCPNRRRARMTCASVPTRSAAARPAAATTSPSSTATNSAAAPTVPRWKRLSPHGSRAES